MNNCGSGQHIPEKRTSYHHNVSSGATAAEKLAALANTDKLSARDSLTLLTQRRNSSSANSPANNMFNSSGPASSAPALSYNLGVYLIFAFNVHV